MRKIFTYLAAFMLPMAVWGQGGGSQNESETTSLITQETSDNIIYVYANGNPIVITEAIENSNSNNVLITSGSKSVTVDGSKAYIFGGSKEKTVENTNITLTSGTVLRIYGGGNSTEKNNPGDVTSTVTIDINGGEVSDLVTAGGNQYCIVKTANVTIDDAEVGSFHAGGFASPSTDNTFDTSFDNSTTKVETLNLTANNSTFSKFIGFGGGQGYSYTKESIIRINNCNLGGLYGVLYNGNAINIDSEIVNSTFGENGQNCEIAAINRGALETARFVFDGCSFVGNVTCLLGPAIGWASSDTNGEPRPVVKESLMYIFKNTKTETPDIQISEGLGNADVTLTGAKAIVKLFDPGTKGGDDITSFTINSGKTWNLDGGLEIAEGCSLTNNGNLTVKCPDVESLISSVAAGANVIELEDKEYVLDKQLVVNKAVTINGVGINETILTANHKGNWPGQNSSQKNLVSLVGKGSEGTISLSGMTIQNSVASGMNAQTGYAVVLDNVAFKNNTNAGLIVHGSVVANGIVTEGNNWGGVNVDKGDPLYQISFKFDDASKFNENNKVWSDGSYEATDEEVEKFVIAPTSWNTYTANGVRYWTNKEIASTDEINVVYEVKDDKGVTDKATIKVKYGDKPALSYSAVPKGKPIQIIVEPMVGYTLSSATVTVNGGTELTATENYVYDYTVGNDGIKIKAVVTVAEDGSTPEGVESVEIVTEETISSVTNPTVVANQSDFTGLKDGEKVVIISKEISKEDDEFETYIKAINANSANVVAYNIAPFTVDNSSNKVTGKTNVAEGSKVTLAFPYPTGYNKSDLESVTVYHFADNGTIEEFAGNKVKLENNYISISGVKSFSPFVLTYTVAEPPVVITYHDLHITESVGAKLVSRNGKDRTPDGGSFTLSLEKEEGYEDCEPTVYYKRGRFGEWKELKLDEVSGYYQIRSVYTDIYVKVSGDGIWPVSNEEVEAQEVKVYTQNGAIVVSTPSLMDVQIISMTGSVVAADKVAGQREFRNLAEGIYVVRVGDKIVKVRL